VLAVRTNFWGKSGANPDKIDFIFWNGQVPLAETGRKSFLRISQPVQQDGSNTAKIFGFSIKHLE
jgi:hypothetical protein